MLEIKNLYYSYPDGHAALNGVNLELKRGERLALVGANGSGKSTLLLHVAGAVAAQRGEIILNNKLINANNINLLREAAGLIFQEPDDQLFMPSVLEDVCFGLIANNIDAQVAKSRAVEISLSR